MTNLAPSDPNFPLGSWFLTASNYFVKRGVLYADLQKLDGSWNQDLVHLKPSMILTNHDGNFISESCMKCTHSDLKSELPNGSWIMTAKNHHLQNGVLYAELRRKDGFYNKTQVNVRPNMILTNLDGEFNEEHCLNCLHTGKKRTVRFDLTVETDETRTPKRRRCITLHVYR